VVTLAEDLYLLATNGATGRLLIDTAHLDLGLGGALLLDLALRGHVELADSQVVVTGGTPTEDPLLDTALTTIAGETKRHGPDHWVHHLARGAHRAVQDHLVDVGVLQRDDERLLHVIPVHRTHESDGRLHHELQQQLNGAVVLGRPPSRETAALAALVLAVGLERHLFPRSDRHEIRRRMAEIADGGWVAPAVAGAVTVVDVALGLQPEPGSLESY
jgi:Golgi phosphoprotein 3 (GPP34)